MVEAYCPVVRGQRFGEKVVGSLVEKYGKTPAQVLMRWSLQKVRIAKDERGVIGWERCADIVPQGFVPLPKSVTPSRIEENADVFDFNIEDEDMAALTTDAYEPCAWDPTTSKD